MMQGQYDNYNQQLKTNPLTKDLSHVKINNSSFMPVIEIKEMDFSRLKDFDVYEEKSDSFSYDKISEYI